MKNRSNYLFYQEGTSESTAELNITSFHTKFHSTCKTYTELLPRISTRIAFPREFGQQKLICEIIYHFKKSKS